MERSDKKRSIAVVPGDGIGKEVIPAALKVVEATGAAVEFSIFDWSADRYLKDGTTIPPDGFAMLERDFDAIFVGALGDPRVPTNIHAKEILLGMRFKMDLYANVRPVKLLDEALCPLKGIKPEHVDFVVIRENTEGPYVDAGGVLKQGTADEIATQEDFNTRKGVERVIRFAFELARKQGRKKVLMSDKSNVMTFAGGLWQRVFKIVAADYPEIQTQHMYVDALCMHMARDPKQFDVIVTNNMFGDIITDLAAALQGGLGMAASGNIHPGKTSMFEPVHGSAPPFAGKNIANPIGAISTAAMMLEHLGFANESERINKAVFAAVQQKKTTADIGGSLGTKEAAEWIGNRIAGDLTERYSNPNALNTKKGKDFQEACAAALKILKGGEFDFEVPLDASGKIHRFDIASRDRLLVAECKAFTWTSTGNIPAAKMTTLKEAIGYLRSLPLDKKLFLFIQQDFHPEKKETLGAYFVRLNRHLLTNITVLELSLAGGEPKILHGE